MHYYKCSFTITIQPLEIFCVVRYCCLQHIMQVKWWLQEDGLTSLHTSFLLIFFVVACFALTLLFRTLIRITSKGIYLFRMHCKRRVFLWMHWRHEFVRSFCLCIRYIKYLDWIPLDNFLLRTQYFYIWFSQTKDDAKIP